MYVSYRISYHVLYIYDLGQLVIYIYNGNATPTHLVTYMPLKQHIKSVSEQRSLRCSSAGESETCLVISSTYLAALLPTRSPTRHRPRPRLRSQTPRQSTHRSRASWQPGGEEQRSSSPQAPRTLLPPRRHRHHHPHQSRSQ